jgi:CTP synthase
MRLGAWKCDLVADSIVGKTYHTKTIEERHRHRYEYNNEYREQLEAAGLKTTGVNPETGLVEIIEIEWLKFRSFSR